MGLKRRQLRKLPSTNKVSKDTSSTTVQPQANWTIFYETVGLGHEIKTKVDVSSGSDISELKE
ncbi:10648_t:CDS:2, partial [Paraglomus occultum]